jgi:hypothetical protein
MDMQDGELGGVTASLLAYPSRGDPHLAVSYCLGNQHLLGVGRTGERQQTQPSLGKQLTRPEAADGTLAYRIRSRRLVA